MKKLEEFINLKENKELGDVVMNTISGVGDRVVSKKPSARSVLFANKFFRPLNEIIDSLSSIHNIAIYINNFPYRRHNISRVAYLRYHIENYYEEMYILKERLISYLNIIKKLYRNSDRKKLVEETLEPLFSYVSEVLKDHVDIRGAHVHANRYSDDDLERLSTFELLTSQSDDLADSLTPLYYDAYRQVRRKWRKRIKSEIAALDTLINIYFEHVLVCTTLDDQFVFPTYSEKQQKMDSEIANLRR